MRGTKFITGALTAALTFGLLTFTLGQRQYSGWHGHQHRGYYNNCDNSQDRDHRETRDSSNNSQNH